MTVHVAQRFVALLAAMAPILSLSKAAELGAAGAAEGKALFTRRWEVRDALSPGGDGLGPLYNAQSCAECHRLGGVGGAGPNERNVELLVAASLALRDAPPSNDTIARLKAIHPGLAAQAGGAGAAIVLHRFSSDEHYERWRDRLIATLFKAHPARAPARPVLASHSHPQETSPPRAQIRGMRFELVQRSTPPLFGLGLVDAVPQSLIAEVAASQAASPGPVRGRVPILADGRSGRFGWRGQVASLADFVQAACANELGLELPRLAQAVNPRTPRYKTPGVDLDAAGVHSLVRYVASLPAPRQWTPAAAGERRQWASGERVFARLGCEVCHRRDMGPARQLYSDLLLHDMGPLLADPVAAPSSSSLADLAPSPLEQIVSFYSGRVGRSIAVDEADPRRQWRTTPLWGVASSAPYLHDGRAATLAEAIEWHGGEGQSASRAFRQLPPPERLDLLAFLESLVAPDLVAPNQE